MNHGEAVAVGLSLISEVAVRRGIMAEKDKQRIDNLLTKFGFCLYPPVEGRHLLREVK